MKPNIEIIMRLALQEADKREMEAGYAGEQSDRGANRLREVVEFYRHGMNGEIPLAWQQFEKQAVRESDPEHAEYLRLKAKFEK